MSDRSSAGAGCSTTGSTSPDSSTGGSASETSFEQLSFADAGLASLSTVTWSLLPTPSRTASDLSESTSSPAGSRARELASPAGGRDSVIPRLRFGERCSESFATFDPATCSWRTSQLSFDSMMGSASERSSPDWPRAGTWGSGIACPLLPLALRTDAIASSSPLLPTPVANDTDRSPEAHLAMKGRMPGGSRKAITSLQVLAKTGFDQPLLPTPNAWDGRRGADFARANREESGGDDLLTGMVKLLPTPHAADGTGGRVGRNPETIRTGKRPSGAKESVPLAAAIDRLLPTPTETDSAGSRRSTARTDEWTSNPGTTLTDAALESSGVDTAPQSSDGKSSSAGLRLSPSFVEWMMGAPDGWTDPACPLSATEFSCKPDGSSDDGSSSTR